MGEKQAKRGYSELRYLILNSLKNGEKSLNELSRDSGVNWKTCDNHLIWLIGMEWVEEVFSSKYVRIFKISEKGKERLSEGKFG